MDNLQSKVTIVINSCDAFNDMWKNVLDSYEKYWPNHPKLMILTDTNKEHLFKDRIVQINKDMSDRLIDVVSLVKTDFIFLSFDDYYLKKGVNHALISNLVLEMEKNGFDYCRLFDKPKAKGKKNKVYGYYKMPLEEYYEVNFYPSIWKKDALLKVLKSGEEIWKAEARITRRAKENNLNCICRTNKGVFEFIDVVRKGKYLRSAYRYLKRNDLYISDRGVRTVKETVSLNTRIFISDHTPKKVKDKLKARLNKKGRVFYSDYADSDE